MLHASKSDSFFFVVFFCFGAEITFCLIRSCQVGVQDGMLCHTHPCVPFEQMRLLLGVFKDMTLLSAVKVELEQ